MAGINREFKDRLFKYIFGSEENKAWALSLYNAVNGTNYTDENSIELTTIDDALYMGMKNDVSFLFSGTMNLYEQQSSFNPNMPLRFLFYAAMVYSSYVESNKLCLYDSYVEYIPSPRCICFYNGKKEIGERMELKLSDAFMNNTKGDIEIKATLINVNYGKNPELLEACKPLGNCSWFIEKIRENKKNGMTIEDAVNAALDEMPSDFCIKPFLMKNREEVEMMCITEYNEAETYELYGARCEARGEARGEAKGRAEGTMITLLNLLRKGLINEDSAAESMGMTVENFRKASAVYCK